MAILPNQAEQLAATSVAVSPAGEKKIVMSRAEARKLLKNFRQARKTNERASRDANIKAPVASTQNPLNQGVVAALLILGIGLALILLGSLLPVIGSIIGWILGTAVISIGIAFLVLTVMGFSVRIIG